MILAILGTVLQALVVVVLLAIILFVTSLFFNWARMILYYISGGKLDFITEDEKVRFGMIEQNTLNPEVEIVCDPLNQTNEEFWDNMNAKLDRVNMERIQSQSYPDEFLFQGRVKRRRRRRR